MLTVQRAKEVHDEGIQVFAVGFGGSMPDHLKRTLNWVAKHGGTFNPDPEVPKTADNYNIADYLPSDNDVCALTTDTGDPAKFNISGYAFLAENASQLSKALKTIITYIKERSFSFTVPTVPTVRLIDEEDNVIYISSFIPTDTPYWRGNLKKYNLNEEGILSVDAEGNPLVSDSAWGTVFDPILRKEVAAGAADKLKTIAPEFRNIFAVKNNALISFDYGSLTNEDLGVTSDSERADLINHIRGIDAFDVNGNGNKTETREWKLGDIFHSNPVIVGAPSKFFIEQGFSGPGGFYEKNKGRKKVVIVGANDGMLHAFDASNGVELWALIPNAVLKTLDAMKTAHTYYVDASPKVADVWFDTNGDGMKTFDEWRTVLVCGLRKGGKHYFALDITDTQNPKYLWEFPKTAGVLDRIGQSWSEPAIGRVKIEQGSDLVEKWVAFVGGGYDPYDEKKGTEATMGNVFFVIDIMTGEIIKEFSGLFLMRHSFPAPPTAVDSDQNGYVDKVYAGDLAGQMWVFDVAFDGITKKSDSQWEGQRLFMAPKEPFEKHNCYYQPAVAFDKYGNPWVYYGTGDKENPTDTVNPQERFYAVIDDEKGTYPREEKDLKDVTNVNTFSVDRTKKGWFIKLEKTGNRLEKVLGKPAVFNKLLYFTTFFYNDKADPCSVSGDSKLYVVEYLSGGGAVELADYMKGTPSERSRIIGEGVPSSPVITVNMKGKDSVIVGTTSGDYYSTKVHSPVTLKEILYWREVVP
jgi:type IV pilus assembly protein PilY1